jgi:hypothetical protein
VSLDPARRGRGRVADSFPGLRFFWDFDAKVSKLYGVAPVDADGGRIGVRRSWIVLDPTLRVLKVVPFADDGSDAAEVLAFVEALPPPAIASTKPPAREASTRRASVSRSGNIGTETLARRRRSIDRGAQ